MSIAARSAGSDATSSATSGATIAALRERGAQRFEPVHFRFIEALARRAQAHGGDVRRLLDGRLASLLAAYGERFERARLEAVEAVESGESGESFRPGESSQSIDRGAPPAPGGRPQRGALADLVDSLERHAGPPAELKTARDFRSTWSKLSVDRRMTQSLAKLPGNAGPLHSHGLVLRALEAMRDLSPEYLNRFMLHVDALLWLEQANGGSAPEQKDVVRPDGDRKRKAGRGKAG